MILRNLKLWFVHSFLLDPLQWWIKTFLKKQSALVIILKRRHHNMGLSNQVVVINEWSLTSFFVLKKKQLRYNNNTEKFSYPGKENKRDIYWCLHVYIVSKNKKKRNMKKEPARHWRTDHCFLSMELHRTSAVTCK